MSDCSTEAFEPKCKTKMSESVTKALSVMRIWISEDAHLGESEISRELEKAEGLRKLAAIEQAIAATLGEEKAGRKSPPEGGPGPCGQPSDDIVHDAATLGSGKLTAEQVGEAIERNFMKVCVLDDGKPVEWREDWVCRVGIDYKAIADELNAVLGSGTCERTTTRNGKFKTKYGRKVPLCECCGYAIGDDRYNFCPKCGAKIVKAVER